MFYIMWQVLLWTFEPETLIKFHVLFGKSALECYKLLKEG
jgi:cephalosporin hydroxylase